MQFLHEVGEGDRYRLSVNGIHQKAQTRRGVHKVAAHSIGVY
jgi:hypothetical protein